MRDLGEWYFVTGPWRIESAKLYAGARPKFLGGYTVKPRYYDVIRAIKLYRYNEGIVLKMCVAHQFEGNPCQQNLSL